MPPLSIVFCGTPKFACPSLQALANDPAFKITHVITQPDKPTGRKQEMTAPPVKILAEKLGIPVLQPKDINSQFSISPRLPHRRRLRSDPLPGTSQVAKDRPHQRPCLASPAFSRRLAHSSRNSRRRKGNRCHCSAHGGEAGYGTHPRAGESLH